MPDGLNIFHAAVTEERVLIAASSATIELAMYAWVPGQPDLATVHVPPGVPEADNFHFEIDPAGTIYAAQSNWLGRLVEER